MWEKPSAPATARPSGRRRATPPSGREVLDEAVEADSDRGYEDAAHAGERDVDRHVMGRQLRRREVVMADVPRDRATGESDAEKDGAEPEERLGAERQAGDREGERPDVGPAME